MCALYESIKEEYFSFLDMVVLFASFAYVKITSPNGSAIIFSQNKQGENIDLNAWRKIYFIYGSQRLDLSHDDRYYTEDSSSKVSPSGKLQKIISAEVVNYLNSLKKVLFLDSKTPLYASPSDNDKTEGYLISGDKMKIKKRVK